MCKGLRFVAFLVGFEVPLAGSKKRNQEKVQKKNFT